MQYLATLMSLYLLASCATTPGDSKPLFAPCPSSPNCVSSKASEQSHRIDALPLAMSDEQAWPLVVDTIAAMPRTRVVSQTGNSLRAVVHSRLFRFVDDLELQLDADKHQLDIRSASRLGYSDLGVNRARVEQIKTQLQSQGIVK